MDRTLPNIQNHANNHLNQYREPRLHQDQVIF